MPSAVVQDNDENGCVWIGLIFNALKKYNKTLKKESGK